MTRPRIRRAVFEVEVPPKAEEAVLITMNQEKEEVEKCAISRLKVHQRAPAANSVAISQITPILRISAISADTLKFLTAPRSAVTEVLVVMRVAPVSMMTAIAVVAEAMI